MTHRQRWSFISCSRNDLKNSLSANKRPTCAFPSSACSQSKGRVWVEVRSYNTGQLVRRRHESREEGHSSNHHICFCWQRVQDDNGAQFAVEINVWRFPHIHIPESHKTHLLTLNWHTWEGFPSGEWGTRERGWWRRMWRESRTAAGSRILTKYEKLSLDVPIPLWSTSTWTMSVLSCVAFPVTQTNLRD